MLASYMLNGSIHANKDDIFYKPSYSEDWKSLYDQHYLEVAQVNSEAFKKKYEELMQGMVTLNAAASKGLESDEISLKGVVKTGFNAVLYTIFPSKAKKQAELFLSNPDPQKAANVLNLLDCKYTKGLLRLVMPSIKVNNTIYVPKLLQRLTLENVLSDRDLSSHLRPSPESHLEGVSHEVKIEPYITEKLKQVPDQYVKIRILSPYTLPYEWKPGEKIDTKGMNFDRIIVNIHGGGFIATTTRCHQTYLRKWAKKCNLVIFAIDYKLAPEGKYPALLDDIWQAYYWIITQSEKEFGIKLTSVIVAGDSAGGNLSMALTLFAIRSKFRVPDGILVGYPALNLSISAFTPSLLTAMDDLILSYSFLNVCINSYIPPEADAAADPYLSPTLISDEELTLFPPIRIMAAGRDPLRDESYKLLVRLAKLNKDAKMIEYRNFPHAFWNMDLVFGLKECKFATKRAIEWIGNLIDLNVARLAARQETNELKL